SLSVGGRFPVMFDGGSPTMGTGGTPVRQPARSAAHAAVSRTRFSTAKSITETCTSACARPPRMTRRCRSAMTSRARNRLNCVEIGLIVCRPPGTAIARSRDVQRCFQVEGLVPRRLSGVLLAALLTFSLGAAVPAEARQGHVHVSGGVAVGGG